LFFRPRKHEIEDSFERGRRGKTEKRPPVSVARVVRGSRQSTDTDPSVRGRIKSNNRSGAATQGLIFLYATKAQKKLRNSTVESLDGRVKEPASKTKRPLNREGGEAERCDRDRRKISLRPVIKINCRKYRRLIHQNYSRLINRPSIASVEGETPAGSPGTQLIN